jgi:hypothetical protein
MSREIVLGVEIETQPTAIAERLATPGGIASFWRSDVREDGEAITIGFPEAPSRLPVSIERIGDTEVRWAFGGDWPFWEGSTGDWALSSGERGTMVVFRHLDYGEGMPDPAFGSVAMTWAGVVGALQRAAETGVAAPALG